MIIISVLLKIVILLAIAALLIRLVADVISAILTAEWLDLIWYGLILYGLYKILNEYL